jgi:hypothetical protein
LRGLPGCLGSWKEENGRLPKRRQGYRATIRGSLKRSFFERNSSISPLLSKPLIEPTKEIEVSSNGVYVIATCHSKSVERSLSTLCDQTRRVSEEFVGDAEAFFRACRHHQLERMVSKLAHSPYRSGRSTTWLKTKCFTEGDFILLGIDRDRKTRAPRALLAKTEGGHLEYAPPSSRLQGKRGKNLR